MKGGCYGKSFGHGSTEPPARSRWAAGAAFCASAASARPAAMEFVRWSLGFTTFEWSARWPATWNGVALAEMQACDVAAPCFGARCGGRKNGKHKWHPSGTEMLP